MTRTIFRVAPIFFLVAGCVTATVNMDEPRRVVGSVSSVRVDAEIIGDEIYNGARIPVTYKITNQRDHAIAVADLISESSFDADTRTITVTVGSEVPGQELLPRLIEIGSGEMKTFTTMARVTMPPPRIRDPLGPPPSTELRLKVNFLGSTGGFEALIGISERAIANRSLADSLFSLWIERNEVVYTNSVPMHWRGGVQPLSSPGARVPSGVGGGGVR